MQVSANEYTDQMFFCLQVLNEELLGTKSQLDAEQEKVSTLESRVAELEVGFLQGRCQSNHSKTRKLTEM